MLLIQARGVQTLTIINTNAQLIFIDSDSLRLLHITNCTFDSFSIFKTFMDNIDIFIHKSSVKDGTSLNFNVLLDVSESIGFHNLIDDAFDHRPAIVNLSLCNLDNPPQFRMSITTLDLSHNNLSSWFYSSRIQKIHLQNNSIREIKFTSDLSESEAQLIYLDLSDNLISSIREYDLVKLPNLLQFKIRSNRLENIHENAFSFITKLQLLDLSSNFLHTLTRNHFLYLSKLQYLYL